MRNIRSHKYPPLDTGRVLGAVWLAVAAGSLSGLPASPAPTPAPTQPSLPSRVVEQNGVRLEIKEQERPHGRFIVFALSGSNSSGKPRTITARIEFGGGRAEGKSEHECLVYLPLPGGSAEKKLLCQLAPNASPSWEVKDLRVFELILPE